MPDSMQFEYFFGEESTQFSFFKVPCPLITNPQFRQLSNDKALKMLAEPDTNKGVGLIERIKQGQGKPTKIFVKRFTTTAIPPQPEPERYPVPPVPAYPGSPNPDFSEPRPSFFPTSAPPKNRGDDLEKAECNQTDINRSC